MFRKLYAASPPLAITGWVNLGLLVAFALIAPFDHRLILGINPWIKPMKFAVSIAIFVWTTGWLLQFLPRPQKAISWGVSVAMMIEMICIAGQSARGTTSHFNNSTIFDGVVFGVMGATILANSALIAGMLWLFWRPVKLAPAVLWGIRLGLVIFLLASGEGGLMVGHQAHTVGQADGGPGLPLVNWSTVAGDLRVSHFVGLHALQALPLAGWLFARRWPRQAVMGVALLAGVWLMGFALLLSQALAGRPLTGG